MWSFQSLPPEELLVDIGAVVGVTLLVSLLIVGVSSLGLAFATTRQKQRLEASRRSIPDDFDARLDEENADWDSWASNLSGADRAVLYDEIDRQIRERSNHELHQIPVLLEGLEMGLEHLDRLDRPDRLRVLRWLTILKIPVESDRLFEVISDDPDERAAATRLLLVTDRSAARSIGPDLLLTGKALTVYGMDTLYRLFESDPTILFSTASRNAHRWNADLIIQVLGVIHRCERTEEAPLRWVIELLEHDSVAARTTASVVLEMYDQGIDGAESVDQELPHSMGHKPTSASVNMGFEHGDPK